MPSGFRELQSLHVAAVGYHVADKRLLKTTLRDMEKDSVILFSAAQITDNPQHVLSLSQSELERKHGDWRVVIE